MKYGTSYRSRPAPPRVPRPSFLPPRRLLRAGGPAPLRFGAAELSRLRTRAVAAMADPQLQLVAQRIRSFPDFPTPGVLFRCSRAGAGWPPGTGRPEGPAGLGRCPARRVGRSGCPRAVPQGTAIPAPRPDPGVTRPVLARQGHLAPPEGPQLLPRGHQPPGEPSEEDPRRQDRLHRGQVEGRG